MSEADGPNSLSEGALLREQTTAQGQSPTCAKAPADVEARLVVAFCPGGPSPDGEVRLRQDGDVLAVGRDVSRPGLCILDERVSRLHCRIAWDRRCGRFRIGDAESTNGVFVNTNRITTSLLNPSDVIRVGDTVLVYQEGDAMGVVRERATRLAQAKLGVLILGETGVGKEVIARRIHEQSGRRGAFLAANCAALPEALAAAELFGHTRGAFSGAAAARSGLFAAAREGTLFLDEVGDLPLDLQPLLLRALEGGQVRPVGAERELPIDVRVVAATHQDLEAACVEGRFRDDLHARLAQAVLVVPALRLRRGEIPTLISEFASRRLTLTADAAESLLNWHWPHNVRELKAWIEGFEAMSGQSVIDFAYVHEHHPRMAGALLARNLQDPTLPVVRTRAPPGREELKQLLRQADGNISKVADTLGKPRAQVYRWMKMFGIPKRAGR